MNLVPCWISFKEVKTCLITPQWYEHLVKTVKNLEVFISEISYVQFVSNDIMWPILRDWSPRASYTTVRFDVAQMSAVVFWIHHLLQLFLLNPCKLQYFCRGSSMRHPFLCRQKCMGQNGYTYEVFLNKWVLPKQKKFLSTIFKIAYSTLS